MKPVTILLAFAVLGLMAVGAVAQPLWPDDDSDLEGIEASVKRFKEIAIRCSIDDCPEFSCNDARDAFERLRIARKYMDFYTYWLDRGRVKIPGSLLADRKKKTEVLFRSIDELLRTRPDDNESTLTHCFMKKRKDCGQFYTDYLTTNQPWEKTFAKGLGDDKALGAVRFFSDNVAAQTKSLSQALTITNSARPNLELSKLDLLPEESFAVKFTAPGCLSSRSWIGVVPFASDREESKAYAASSNSRNNRFLMKKTSGVLSFAAPPKTGLYEVRMYSKESGKLLVFHRFQVLRKPPNGWTTGVLGNSSDGTCRLAGTSIYFKKKHGPTASIMNLLTGEIAEGVVVTPGAQVPVAISKMGQIHAYRFTSAATAPVEFRLVFASFGGATNGWRYFVGCADGTRPQPDCFDGKRKGTCFGSRWDK